MSGGNTSYIDKAELRKTFNIKCVRHNLQFRDEFLGREAQHEAVSIQHVTCLRGILSTRRKTSRSKDENQQQSQPTYDAEFENQTRATLMGTGDLGTRRNPL